MAGKKKIKFPLKMADGYQARELEELQEHFDLESAISYFSSGQLQLWLQSNYNGDVNEELEKLSGDEEDFVQQFTEALGVDCDIENFNVGETMEKSRLRKKLKELFPNQKVEEMLPYTVETQEQLQALCKEKVSKIYLFKNEFFISKEISNIQFIGIDNPRVEIENHDRKEFLKQKIGFTKVNITDEEIKKIVMGNYESAIIGFLDVLEDFIKVNSGRKE